MSLVIRILHWYFIVYYYTGSSSVNWLAVSCILTVTLWDTGFKCKSSTPFMCLIINHFVMYYSNPQVNYMVTVFIRLVIAVVYTLHLLSCSKCFVCLCLFQYRHCFLVGWCTNKSYVIATSDLGAGIAQWLEHRTRDWKVAGSNPCWNGGRIFFSRVDFLCWLLFRYPFHPRVTTVARKKSRSFCQKCRWQVTAKHAYTLRIEPCFGIGHNLSLICQMTSEDIKHQLNNNNNLWLVTLHPCFQPASLNSPSPLPYMGNHCWEWPTGQADSEMNLLVDDTQEVSYPAHDQQVCYSSTLISLAWLSAQEDCSSLKLLLVSCMVSSLPSWSREAKWDSGRFPGGSPDVS